VATVIRQQAATQGRRRGHHDRELRTTIVATAAGEAGVTGSRRWWQVEEQDHGCQKEKGTWWQGCKGTTRYTLAKSVNSRSKIGYCSYG
jgi:hypothetical protein